MIEYFYCVQSWRISTKTLVFLICWSCSTGFCKTSSSEKKSLPSRSLVLNWKAEPQFGGFYAAQFKNPIQIKEGGSGTPTLIMVQSGVADYGVVSGEEVLLSRDRSGEKNSVVAIFAAYQESPLVLISHEKRNFKSIEDFFKQDGILAVQSGLAFFQFLKKKYGAPKAKVVPYSGGVQFFLANPEYSQQGFLTSEPLLIEKAGKKSKVFLVAEAGFRPYNTVVIVRESFLRSNREEVAQFVQDIRAGWAAYLKDPHPTNAKMGRLNPAMDAETFEKSAKAQVPLIRTTETQTQELGSMTSKRWKELIQTLLDLEILKKPIAPESVFENL
jgi:NitT/TauT family transport system substrate-binding protein